MQRRVSPLGQEVWSGHSRPGHRHHGTSSCARAQHQRSCMACKAKGNACTMNSDVNRSTSSTSGFPGLIQGSMVCTTARVYSATQGSI